MCASWDDLPAGVQAALDQAWASCRAGSLGIGSAITDDDGVVVATGRNRLMEVEPGDDVLAGTSLAHAEMNALAKLRWRGHDHQRLTLWTSLQPCLMCTGAIRLAPIAEVRYLAPDPLFAMVDRIASLDPYLAARWPAVEGPTPGPLGVFGMVLPIHLAALWGAPIVDAWADALPRTVELGRDLAASGEVLAAVERGDGVTQLLDALWERLEATASADLGAHRDGSRGVSWTETS